MIKRIGFTNTLACVIVLLIALDLIGGFYLAVESIKTNYMGSLVCWTVVSTPIGTAATIVLAKIVDKSKAENTDNGKGIKYASAEAKNFSKPTI